MIHEHASKFKGPYKAPVLFIVTNDLSKPIATISMKELSEDARSKARELTAKIKSGDIKVGGDAAGQAGKEEAKDPAKKEENGVVDDPKDEKDLLLPSQEWTNHKGDKIKAGVVKVDGDKVLFRMPNGKELAYDISKLSEDSRAKLKALTAPASE